MKKSNAPTYRYVTDRTQKIEFRRRGREWPQFRLMRVESPTSLLEVLAKNDVAYQGGSWRNVPDDLLDHVPETV